MIGGPPATSGRGITRHIIAQSIDFAVERDWLLTAQEPSYNLEALLEPGEAAVGVQQLEAVGSVLAFLPAGA